LICRELEKAVTDYLDGALEPELRRDFEAHHGGCPACQRHLQQIRATIHALRGLPPAAPPAALHDAVVAAYGKRWVRESPGAPIAASGRTLRKLDAFTRRPFAWAWAWLAVFAACLLAGLSGPGAEIDRPGVARICLPIELLAGVLPALGVLLVCRLQRQRIAARAFALVAASGALVGQIVLLALCPLPDARAHALVIHAGGVAVAMVVGAALGWIPVAPRWPQA
jgi:hypothetical protein